MTAQPVEANVVLTADNSQYDQAMNQSSMTTDRMGQSVDTLGSKISKLTKTAGKSLIGISAADVALIGGATAAWSSYEKQMSRLQAQSAVLGRTNADQNKLMKDYTGTVKTLRNEYGLTTTAAAGLVETLSKITNIRQSRDLTDLSKVFVDMSRATGESSDGLASSLTNLQKLMGTPISAKSTRQYADQFTYLAAQTNTSAQGLIDFTAQLAPTAKAMGMTHNQIAGFATAFAKAGQDSGPAAQVFTKITSDITHSMQTGSPEIAHYANMLGVTQRQFKQMGGMEQVVEIMESLHSNTKNASAELNRMGLDGPRSIRSIQAIIRSGGLREAMGLADTGPGSASQGAAKRGSDAVKNMSEEMERLKEQSKELAETFGQMFGPAIEKFVSGMVKALEVINDIASGPIGQMIGWVMKIVAPFAAGAGAILLFAGALLKLAGVFTLLRNSMAGGVREGFKGGAAIGGMGAENTYLARGDRELGTFGGRLAGEEGKPGSWLQRAQYNAGIYAGRGVRGAPGGLVGLSQWAWEKNPLSSYVRPEGGAGRGLGSYMAGGLGRAIDVAVTPQFDQMRYDDPTKRMAGRVVGQVAPWTTAAQRMGYAGALADEHLAKTQMGRVGEEVTKVTQDPLMTNQAREARLAELKQIQAETQQRVTAATESKTSMMQQIEAQKQLSRETGNTSTGFRRLRESLGGLGGAAGGGILGAGKLGFKGFMASGMAYPAAGLAATAAVSAVPGADDSKMLQLGAMGLMMGPETAAIGAVVGATIDMTQANKGLEASLASLKSQTDAMVKSGTGMSDWFDSVDQQQKDLNKNISDTHGSNMFGSISNFFGAVHQFGWRNTTEGGPQGADQRAIDEQRARGLQVEGVARDLAKRTGTKFSGTAANQRRQMDEFMAGVGGQRLQDAGLDPETVINARNAMINSGDPAATAKYTAMIRSIARPDPGATQRMQTTAAGQALMDSPAARRASVREEDVSAYVKGVDQIFDSMHKAGMSNLDMLRSVSAAQHKIGDDNNRQSEILEGVYQKNAQSMAMQAPLMGRQAQFQQSIQQLGVLEGQTPNTPAAQQRLEQQKQATAGGVLNSVQYVQQMLLMQDQYEISRKRAQDDYAEQQSYQLQDFNLQRSRAEYQFNLGRDRSVADYYRNVKRNNYEFNLQRKRQEEDFAHSTELQAKQMAQTIYNVYQRVDVERTSSAEWILSNAQDQLNRMAEQEKNLKTLRRRGVSDAVIQNMGLTAPEHAQQLAALVTELTPSMIKRFNSVIGKQRVDVAKDLVTDPSDLNRQETLRSYRRGRAQSLEDHNRSMRQGREDFFRQLRQQKDDFNTLLKNQDTDFQTSQDRQEKAYRKSMNRSAEDLANAGKEITGSIESILKQGSTQLTGYAQDAASAALDTFTGLKKSTRPVAVSIMKDLADIFGFEYKAPKLSNMSAPPSSTTGPRRFGTQDAYHTGGTVPGYNPGKDTHMVAVGGGEAIMRPEWTRAVGGEKAVQAMNHAARHGGFAKGGVVWPLPNSTWSTYPGHDGIDLNSPNDLGKPYYAAVPGKISYVGWNHGYGDAVFETGPYGTLVYGHASKVGVHQGQMVQAGQWLGNVGSTGHSTGPHLHIGFPGGTSQEILSFLHGAEHSGYGEAGVSGPQTSMKMLKHILKDRYASAEKAAYDLQGAHPLDPGQISAVINRYARKAIHRYAKKYGVAGAEGDAGAVFGNEPNANLSNEGIVHVGANRMGWGDQWGALRQIVMHESGFNNTAQNPTSSAYGMFQFLDSTWGNYGGKKTSDPWKQTEYGLDYIKQRYKDPHGAWKFWQDHNWYGDGSIFTSPTHIGVGERGPEAVIPLNDRGGEFLTRAMMGSDLRRIGMGSQPVGGGINVFNTRIDRSTNFNGAITVQANDPNELLTKLKQRQRVMALSRPSLTGSAA